MDIAEYKKILLNIFQEDIFNELMCFWKEVEESLYDYKVFVSKKCFVLYKTFVPVFNFNSYKFCKKITDTAIPLYLSKMKNAKVLVIDDVFIHGRAASKVAEQIGGKAKKIVYYTFAKNNNNSVPQDTSIEKSREEGTECDISLNYIEKLNKVLLAIQDNSVKGYIDCSEYQWKRISDLIMKSLWGVNMPYASYLPIFVLNDKNRLFTTKSSQNFIKYSSHSQKEQGQHFTYYIRSNEDHVANDSKIHFCFVVSQNDFFNDCKMMPMVFFDCENTCIDKRFIINAIKIIYGSDISSFLYQYFVYNGKCDQGLISLLKYLIFSVGFLYSKKYFEDEGIKENEYYIDFSNAEYSFGTEVMKYLYLLKENKNVNLLIEIEKCTIKNPIKVHKNIYLDEHEVLLGHLKQSYMDMRAGSLEQDMPEIIDILVRYFKLSNIYSEQNFLKFRKNRKKYIIGLKFSEIKEFLEKRKFSCKDIIFGLMYQYNQGAATIDFIYNRDKNDHIIGINMYWRAGEQSYKCISQKYVLIVYFQNEYNKLFEKKIAYFLYEILLDIARNNYKLWDIPFTQHDLEKYCNSGDNVYNAFDIDHYCEKKEYMYLGYVAQQIQQYVISGHFEEIKKDDKYLFKINLLKFMKNHTKKEILENCNKILF